MIHPAPSCWPLPTGSSALRAARAFRNPFRTMPRSTTGAEDESLDLGASIWQACRTSPFVQRPEPRLPFARRFPCQATIEHRAGHSIFHRSFRIATTSSQPHHAPRAGRESMPQTWGIPPSLEVVVGAGFKPAPTGPSGQFRGNSDDLGIALRRLLPEIPVEDHADVTDQQLARRTYADRKGIQVQQAVGLHRGQRLQLLGEVL